MSQAERTKRLRRKYELAGMVRLTVWVPARYKQKIIAQAGELRELAMKSYDFDRALKRLDKTLGLNKLKAKKNPPKQSRGGSSP